MVEGTPLLRVQTGNRLEGSNPFVSAKILRACSRLWRSGTICDSDCASNCGSKISVAALALIAAPAQADSPRMALAASAMRDKLTRFRGTVRMLPEMEDAYDTLHRALAAMGGEA